MRYTHFEITNYKGINHIRLDLDMPPMGKVITLVGLNESGKTTILDAIAYFRPAIDDPDLLSLMELNRANPNDLIPIASKSNFNDTVEISCGVELSDEDEDALREFLRTEHNFRCTFIPRNLTLSDRYQFQDSVWNENRGAVWSFRPKGMLRRSRKETQLRGPNPIWLEAIQFLRQRMPRVWYFPNFLFDFPQRIYLEDRDSDDAIERFYRNLLSAMLSAIDTTLTVERHITQRIKSENDAESRALEQLLLRIGREITEEVFGSWNEIFNRKQTTQANVKAGADEDGKCYLEISIIDSDGLYYISERSLGFRWFFVFSLVTRYSASYYSGFDTNQSNVVFLFDEPASNLHASAQSQLLESLAKLADTSTIIYSTHSHHLINPHWLENTYVVRNTGLDYESDISDFTTYRTDIRIERYRSFADANPSQTHYFQPILDVLDYKPSRLEMVEDVVMVEGKNDFYTLAYMQMILNQETLHLMPGTGSGNLDEVIRLYIGWAKNFIVLLDSDAAGKKEKTRYLANFGPILNGRLFTLEDVDPILNGKSLEQAFAPADRKDAIAAVYSSSTYTKTRFNRAIQECLATKNHIGFSPNTTACFTNILGQLSHLLERVKQQ